MVQHLCLSCVSFSQEYLDPYYFYDYYNRRIDVPEQIVYNCAWKLGYIRKLRTKCNKHLSVHQTRLNKGGDKLVKIGDIPTEGERIDLKELPQMLVARATDEYMQAKQEGKSEGLVIKFETVEGKTFAQKYTKVSGAVLMRELTRLKIEDTEDLQKLWVHYELTQMRIGNPRMIPVEIEGEVKADVEE